MKTFQDILATLPPVGGIARIELLDPDGRLAASIENRPGSQGSLRVYRHLAEKHGAITPAAAQEGLALYAEHATDARANPGRHPNIDRLFELIARDATLTARAIEG